MPHRPPSKTLLRKDMRSRRRGLSAAAHQRAAEAVARNVLLLPGWPLAHRIALYLAGDGEIDTTPLSAQCRLAGKQLFLPVVAEQNQLEFAAWLAGDELVANRYGIFEPAKDAPRLPASELDVIVLPLVAWDRQGGRLGMGGGYYDRALSGLRGTSLLGLAHALQEVGQVPRDNWDILLDFVATDTALHCCQGNNKDQET